MPVLTPTGGADFERVHINPGTYRAKLVSIAQFQMPANKVEEGKSPERLRWAFEITSKRTGETKQVEGITSLAWGPGVPGRQVAKAWRWASILMCAEPPLELDTDDLIGLEGSIRVGNRPNQPEDKPASQVEDVVPPEGDF